MSKFIAFLLALVLPVGLVLSAAPTQKKNAASNKKAKSKRRAASANTKKGQTWRTRQLQPTAERYGEIQRALLQKGYLTGEPTGVWSQESIEALRRFQSDQKLEPTGKIDSVSLIALGLGPKHQTAQAAPPPGGQPNP
jgi:peptidoglycan hydrolase-like protein with peptidoglycan-binding domain